MMKDVVGTFDYPAGHAEGYADAIKQVFKQVYNGNKMGLTATFYDGLRQMVINERIYESAKTQKWVKIGEIL
jgi:predicted dehydrogenase